MEIKTDPHPTLYTVSTEVQPEEFKDVTHMARKALKLLQRTPNGIGLAANQVGDTRRWFVSPLFKVCINPSIVGKSQDKSKAEEGCLSKPGFKRIVSRPESIYAFWRDKKNKPVSKQLTGMAARVFQHELDHLNGKNIWGGSRKKENNHDNI